MAKRILFVNGNVKNPISGKDIASGDSYNPFQGVDFQNPNHFFYTESSTSEVFKVITPARPHGFKLPVSIGTLSIGVSDILNVRDKKIIVIGNNLVWELDEKVFPMVTVDQSGDQTSNGWGFTVDYQFQGQPITDIRLSNRGQTLTIAESDFVDGAGNMINNPEDVTNLVLHFKRLSGNNTSPNAQQISLGNSAFHFIKEADLNQELSSFIEEHKARLKKWIYSYVADRNNLVKQEDDGSGVDDNGVQISPGGSNPGADAFNDLYFAEGALNQWLNDNFGSW